MVEGEGPGPSDMGTNEFGQINSPEQAEQMAYAENPYRMMAIKARETGNPVMASIFEKKAGVAGEEAEKSFQAKVEKESAEKSLGEQATAELLTRLMEGKPLQPHRDDRGGDRLSQTGKFDVESVINRISIATRHPVEKGRLLIQFDLGHRSNEVKDVMSATASVLATTLGVEMPTVDARESGKNVNRDSSVVVTGKYGQLINFSIDPAIFKDPSRLANLQAGEAEESTAAEHAETEKSSSPIKQPSESKPSETPIQEPTPQEPPQEPSGPFADSSERAKGYGGLPDEESRRTTHRINTRTGREVELPSGYNVGEELRRKRAAGGQS